MSVIAELDTENSALSHPAAPQTFGELFAHIARVVQENEHDGGEALALAAIETFADSAEGVSSAEVSVLGEVALRAEQARCAQARLDEAVAAARKVGVIWAAIADASGTERVAAYRRWDPKAREKHRSYQRERMRQLRGTSPSSVDGAND